MAQNGKYSLESASKSLPKTLSFLKVLVMKTLENDRYNVWSTTELMQLYPQHYVCVCVCVCVLYLHTSRNILYILNR